ncbi:MAG: ribosome maturation factor RimM [Kineosporiaceae bacterium]|nr:ribosome maturation factor RimM [Aeromicrobium sp.]
MKVVIGRIGRAHGIRGELNVDIRTDEPERRFAPGSSVVYDGGRLIITTARHHSGRLVVRFKGFDDRNAAETLHGKVLELEVDADELPEDPEEFYDHQLVGLEVRAGDRVIGKVAELIHMPAQDTLAIETESGEILVPFVLDLVPEVDLRAGFLRIADVPGLINPDDAENTASDIAASDIAGLDEQS